MSDDQNLNGMINRFMSLFEDYTKTIMILEARLTTLEEKQKLISHYVHGNGEPGLTENFRNFQKELKLIQTELLNLKTNFDNQYEKLTLSFSEDFNTIKTSYSIKEIEKIKAQQKFQWWILSGLGMMVILEFFEAFLPSVLQAF